MYFLRFIPFITEGKNEFENVKTTYFMFNFKDIRTTSKKHVKKNPGINSRHE